MKQDTVTLSPKYQIVIPRRIRDTLGLRPGERFHVMNYEGRVELVRVKRMREMRGFLRGMDTHIERDGDRV